MDGSKYRALLEAMAREKAAQQAGELGNLTEQDMARMGGRQPALDPDVHGEMGNFTEEDAQRLPDQRFQKIQELLLRNRR